MSGERGLLPIKIRAMNNLVAATQFDKASDIAANLELDALTQRVGNENWIVRGHFFAGQTLIDNGDLAGALERVEAAEELDLSEFWADSIEVVRLRAELYQLGYDEERYRRHAEIQAKYGTSNDPQLRSGVLSASADMKLAIGRTEEALEAALEIEEIPNGYPYAIQTAVSAAARLRDASTLKKILSVLEAEHPRGRACRGLARVAQSHLLALTGDVDAAERAFIDAEELWAKTQGSLPLARARAVFALLAGTDHELAVVKAEQARRFFAESGYQLFLDGIMSELPDTEHWFDAGLLDRSVASGG